MSIEVCESISTLKKRCAGAPFLETNPARAKALEHYFSKRGIIQIDTNANAQKWPILVYPSREKLAQQLEEWSRIHETHSSKMKTWKDTNWNAKSKDAFAHAKKVTDPLYWKHVLKKATDGEYRSSAAAIDLHSRLISDDKYRPMIDAFVHNPEYRKQLTETVKTSIVYKNHKGLAKHAQERKKLQLEVSQDRMQKVGEQLNETQAQLNALKELMKWSEEK